MADQVGTSQVIHFATFEVDLQAQELPKAGLRLKPAGQPCQVQATTWQCGYPGGAAKAAVAGHLR